MWEFLKLADAMARPTKVKVVCRPELVPEGEMYLFDTRQVMFGLDETIMNTLKVADDVTKLVVVNDPRDKFKIEQIIEERGKELGLELVE